MNVSAEQQAEWTRKWPGVFKYAMEVGSKAAEIIRTRSALLTNGTYQGQPQVSIASGALELGGDPYASIIVTISDRERTLEFWTSVDWIAPNNDDTDEFTQELVMMIAIRSLSVWEHRVPQMFPKADPYPMGMGPVYSTFKWLKGPAELRPGPLSSGQTQPASFR